MAAIRLLTFRSETGPSRGLVGNLCITFAEFPPGLGSAIQAPCFYGICNFVEGRKLTLASAVFSKKTASAMRALRPLLVGPRHC
jgi:hypothetical protein